MDRPSRRRSEGSNVTKLALGTAQFGMPYGISNSVGVPNPSEIKKILDWSKKSFVTLLDTAPAYLESENVLGQLLADDEYFEIVTKSTAGLAESVDPVGELKSGFLRSLDRLKKKALYGLLIHQPYDLLGKGGSNLYTELLRLKNSGLVKKIGVSVYTSDQADRIIERFKIDLIQVPVNLMDQRLVSSGCLARLKQSGVEVHARSVFLQGLLLLKDQQLPKGFESVREHLRFIRDTVEVHGLTMVQAALGYVHQLKEIDKVLVGTVSLTQLKELVLASNQPEKPWDFVKKFSWDDDKIINPSLWTKNA
jgi:aryl-alcohol dehydrogenase-like predicted oxidoreductase